MKYTLFFILAFWAATGSAQDTPSADTTHTVTDSTELMLGKTKIIIIRNDDDNDKPNLKDEDQEEKSKKKHRNTNSIWGGLQLGVNSYSLLSSQKDKNDNPFLDLNHSKNRSIGLNLFSERIDLGIPWVGLSSGIGLTFNRYALDRNERLEYDGDHIWGSPDTINNFTKNYLITTHISVPVLLELNTHRIANRGFRLAAGIEAGYMIGSRTKVKYKRNNKNQVDKSKGSYNMNPFRLNLVAMAGFRSLTLYAKASPTEFFTEGKGPSGFYHTSFGIILNFD